MNNLLAMTIAGSAVVLFTLLLRPVTAKWFSASWQYRIGKMAIIFFLMPFSIFAQKLASVLVQPITQSQNARIFPMLVPVMDQQKGLLNALNAVGTAHLTIEFIQIVSFIWLFGAIGFASWHLYCYRRFMKLLQVHSIPAPEDTLTLLSSCKATWCIRGDVKLMLNHKITSPMLIGLRHPLILLPISTAQELDLKLILAHELTHLKQKDLWIKMFVLLAGTVHWFNPFVHILRKDISTWSELSCDEVLAAKMSHEERKRYGEAILNTLANHSGINSTFCSPLCESTKHIERRLTMLLNVKKMKKHMAIFAAVVFLIIGGTAAAFATNVSANENKNTGAVEATSYTVIPADKIKVWSIALNEDGTVGCQLKVASEYEVYSNSVYREGGRYYITLYGEYQPQERNKDCVYDMKKGIGYSPDGNLPVSEIYYQDSGRNTLLIWRSGKD
ncbi:hypothetical protein Ami103574_05950 [Aminipila butyrica]|uniref:Peptidase M56 domain-containing protein n=1 Tax=Aminipila butyrica TaxID=433296 RepID=A0A858BVE8_9FIRM|nr:M56 family metallopeptidase [Aminipila butyrica]QIB68890.1 hypothetical protein Ami103574_05950 [Aminipila butyrica]